MILTATDAFALTMKLVGLAALINSAELLFLTRHGEFSAGGVWPWRVIGSASYPRSKIVDPIFSVSSSFPILIYIRLCAAIGCVIVSWFSPAAIALIVALLLTQVLINTRIIFGDDGSDQMTSIVTTVLFFGRLSSGDHIAELSCLVFLAVQGTLSYTCSGVAKTFGPLWRDGTALSRVLGHHTYGHELAYGLLSSRLMLAKIASWGVIAFQIAFIAYWLTPSPWHLAWLCCGLLFHIGIAYLMRLNGFLFAFPCAYPAMIFVHSLIW